MRQAMLAVLFFLIVDYAQAADEAAVSGIGAAKCSAFATAFKESPTLSEGVYFTWAQGYMSGMNTGLLMVKHSFRNLTERSEAEQKNHLRAYCDKWPERPFVDAVLNLYGTMLPQSN